MSVFATTRDHIAHYGNTVIGVLGEANLPRFSYTIVLTEAYGASELLVFGLGPDLAKGLLNDLAMKLKDGVRFVDGDVIADIASLPLALKDISTNAASLYVQQALRWYEDNPVQPSFQQLVLPDRHGYFPWQESFDQKMKQIQPELWNASSQNMT